MSPNIAALARNLRKRPTDAEKLLWRNLRGKQLDGLKFRRRQPIEDYIVEFVCLEKRLVIEVDGGQHNIQKDFETDEWLKKQGFKVIRFWNNEILQNVEGVLGVIRGNC